VLGHLEQQYRDPISLDELAEVGEMSRRTLTREFRRALGCSPIEYLIRLRINHAVTLMQEGDAGVTDISVRVVPIGDGRDELIASSKRTREYLSALAGSL
jgi:transcriptional regulator GlxA family with amidase domain